MQTVWNNRPVAAGSPGPAFPTIGEWVVSDYSPGVWRVFRVERDFYDQRYRLTDPKVKRRTMVFAARLVNAAWKRSFSNEVWSVGLVHPVNREQSDRLASTLAENPGLLAEFDRYVPKPIDLICNLRFSAMRGGFEVFRREVDKVLGSRLEVGLSVDEILGLITSSSLIEHMNRNPGVATLQLNSPDHLRRGDELVFTSFRVLNS